MYKSDLSQGYSGAIHAIWCLLTRRVVRAVSWLDSGHEFPRGEISAARLEALKWLCKNRPKRVTRGFHRCPFCEQYPATTMIDGDEFSLGSREIDVVSPASRCEYRAPNLVVHYIERHGYLPPEEFLVALDSTGLAEPSEAMVGPRLD